MKKMPHKTKQSMFNLQPETVSATTMTIYLKDIPQV